MARWYVRLLCILSNRTVSAVEEVTMDYFNILSWNYAERTEGNKTSYSIMGLWLML
jgi:hypothetical protein